MKKFVTGLLTLILTLTMAGCAATEKTADVIFTKVAENLYEVTYNDYDPDYAAQERTGGLSEFTSGSAAPGGCSAIRVGNYVGRNLDLPYGDFSEVIVHVPAANGRYASVGSFCTLQKLTGEHISENEMNETLFHLIPISICDGINEKGVVCEMNVVPAMDIGMTTGTNPGKPVVNMGNVVRFVLDNAASAKEAVELLEARNLCIPWDWAGSVSAGWEFHYLIADAADTYVVEVINNKLTALKNEEILTNYYLGLENGTENGMGIERRETLHQNREMADSVDGMARLMQLVYWTKVNDTNAENYCYSDHFGTTAPDGTVITKSNYENYKNELLNAGKTDGELTAEMLKTGENPYGLWITLHTCVFDIQARSMQFSMHENPEVVYTYAAK
ncbi:MAG: linear amide C-N hydrolase [Clostridiales bacterium]|nr:linear amide C-N hydrolase [Candidatus Cacconaster stercorequi]